MVTYLEGLEAKKFQKDSARGSSGGSRDQEQPKKLPSMLTAAIKEAVSTMLVPGYGIRPQSPFTGKTGQGPTCWACGKQGHRRGDPKCTAGPNDVHNSAPSRAKKTKRDSGNDGFKSERGGGNICRFFQQHGKCRFGEKCKFVHETGGGSAPPVKKFRLTKAEKKKVTSAAVKFVENSRAEDTNYIKSEDDQLENLLKSFCFVRTIPREVLGKVTVDLSMLKVSPLPNMEDVCHDTGSAEGLTTLKSDMVYCDASVEAQESVIIRGPSVGAPLCAGRGPLLYRL